MYQPRYFKVQELVPPSVFSDRGDKAIELIDERVLLTLDDLRETFGPCTINDWIFDGSYSQSGLRTPDAKEYSPTSQHSFGRAMDCKFKNYSADDIRNHILENRLLFPYITFMEDNTSWLHFDVRNCQRIVLWNPDTKQARQV